METIIEKKITKRETLTLLRMAQKFQLQDCGKHNVSIQARLDDETKKLWFTYTASCGEVYTNGACYEWRTYQENRQVFESFVSAVRAYDNGSAEHQSSLSV